MMSSDCLPVTLPAMRPRRDAIMTHLKLVANVPLRQRIGTEYQMVVCEVRAGNVSDVAARPDSMKTPYERAMLELAIGQTLIWQGVFWPVSQLDARSWRLKGRF